MRILLSLLCPILALSQTKADPSQIKDPTLNTANYFFCSVGGKTGWCQAPSEWTFTTAEKPSEWKVSVSYLWPDLVALTARVSVLESKVDPKPVEEIIVAASEGQTFQLATAPQWGYVRVTRNGLAQSLGKDYDYASGKVTFTVAGTPKVGDLIRLEYWK